MKAAVIYQRGEAPRLEEFPDPVPEQDDVLIQVRAGTPVPVIRQSQ